MSWFWGGLISCRDFWLLFLSRNFHIFLPVCLSELNPFPPAGERAKSKRGETQRDLYLKRVYHSNKGMSWKRFLCNWTVRKDVRRLRHLLLPVDILASLFLDTCSTIRGTTNTAPPNRTIRILMATFHQSCALLYKRCIYSFIVFHVFLSMVRIC